MLRFILSIILLIVLFLFSTLMFLDQFSNLKTNPYYPVSMQLNDGDKRKLNIKVDDEILLKQYDYTTLFYNIFLDYNNKHLVFVGPPLLNLKEKYIDFSVIFNGSKINRTTINERERCYYVKYGVKNVAKNNRVEIHINGHKKQVNIAKNNYKCGDRILITKQKNNRSKWLIDWVKHYTNRYNVTNIIIFDNNSNDFDTINNELAQFNHVQLIPYNFPFGIPGQFKSNFLQNCLLDIGFQQFCKDDAYIFNFDIDELLAINPNNLNNILVNNTGYKAHMIWVPMLIDSNDYSYRDFKYKENQKTYSGGKYIVNKRNTEYLTIHYPKTSNEMVIDEGYFLHFKGISTNWKYKRTETSNIDKSKLVKIDDFLNSN